jgi:hypothetical protein
LELFAGSGHVSEYWRSQGYETVTLDIDPALKPDICVDLLKWKYQNIHYEHFTHIWASPDCTTWSIATHKHRTLEDGLIPKTDQAIVGTQLVHRTHDIIKYFCKAKYVVENPRGRLRSFDPIKMHPFRTTVFYSNYGFNYQKPTDLWSNVFLWNEEKNQNSNTYQFNSSTVKEQDRSLVPLALIKRVFGRLTSEDDAPAPSGEYCGIATRIDSHSCVLCV